MQATVSNIEIGLAATLTGGNRYKAAATVINVFESRNRTLVTVQSDQAILIRESDDGETQVYEYKRNPVGVKSTFAKDKHGNWQLQHELAPNIWVSSASTICLTLGRRESFVDNSY